MFLLWVRADSFLLSVISPFHSFVVIGYHSLL